MAEETTIKAKNKVMLMLGGFKFEADKTAYDELSEQNTWKWQEIERAKDKPTLQYQAQTLKTIAIKGQVFTVKSGLNPFKSLKEEADKGTPLTLVDGLGNVHGKYIIESLKLSQHDFIFEGIPRLISFDLSIKQYG